MDCRSVVWIQVGSWRLVADHRDVLYWRVSGSWRGADFLNTASFAAVLNNAQKGEKQRRLQSKCFKSILDGKVSKLENMQYPMGLCGTSIY
jgi:hypothetical protein